MKLAAPLLAALSLLPSLDNAAAREAPPLPGNSVYQLPAQLRDQRGNALAWRTLRGRPRIVTMFYASCRYVCPMSVDGLRSIQSRLTPAERARIGFVLVSMDPDHDTPAVLSRLMVERRIETPAWIALQPRSQDVRSLAGLLGIRYRPLEDGEFNHTTVLVLLDAEGRIVARTEKFGGAGDAEFVAAVRAAAR